MTYVGPMHEGESQLEATTMALYVAVVLGTFIGLSGYRVSRAAGRSRAQSTVVATLVLGFGVGVALLKNVLGGH